MLIFINTFIISIIIIMIIAKHEETATAYIDLLFQNSPTFPRLLLKFQNSLTNYRIS